MILRRQLGFTLLEVMIVLLMIAFVSGSVAIAVNSASSSDEKLKKVGKKLFAEMNFALDESLIQQRLLGLRIDINNQKTSSYSWLYYEDEQWQTLEEPLGTSTLEDDILLQLTIDDTLLEALLENTLNHSSEEGDAPPSIIFYPNGDVSEFTLSLSSSENEQQDPYQIYLDERGQLTNSVIDDTSTK